MPSSYDRGMDARPVLESIAQARQETGLEAILIGNAAAALQGAPVTTIDIDFFFCPTPHNIHKLKTVADRLGAVMFRPQYPVSKLIRLIRDDDGLQVDFMGAIDGVRSFESLRAKAETVDFGGSPMLVATRAAILKTKRAAGRPEGSGRVSYSGEGAA